MPRIVKLLAPDGRLYSVCSMYDDVIEKVNPALWLGSYKFFQLTQLGGYPESEAREMSIETIKEYAAKPCPDFLMSLFDTTKKKEQERLLRDKAVTPDNLICWFLHSRRAGGLFSQYAFDGGVPQELEGRTPIMVDSSDPNNIMSVGHTDLSDGALMHLVENQKKVIAQFIDFEDGRWYCFYRTHRGLAGRESGNQGQHLHFISSAYGIPRQTLVDGFKRGECPVNGFHVHLTGWHETSE